MIFEVGTGYFGCRTPTGKFDPSRFKKLAADPQVKMVEIKLSQGAKPGHGGMLPAAKISPEIAEARGIPEGVDCISPAGHNMFSNPIELMEFVKQLREISHGKPVGFKLCIGHRREFMCVVKAILETGVSPDFIVIDGKEGGTGAAPHEFANHLGMPLRDALLFAHNTLRGAGIRDQISLGASGKLLTGFGISRAFTLGADWVNSARGFMFAIGCIQAQSCHTNRCPVGVATQDALRQKALDVENKSMRVANFHRNTLKALAELIGAAGLEHPNQLRPHHIMMRSKQGHSAPQEAPYEWMPVGFLLENIELGDGYLDRWQRASANSF